MSYVAKLKERVIRAEEAAEYYKSIVDAFFTGDVPDEATLDHLIVAKWGRKRLEDLKAQPVLLRTD